MATWSSVMSGQVNLLPIGPLYRATQRVGHRKQELFAPGSPVIPNRQWQIQDKFAHELMA